MADSDNSSTRDDSATKSCEKPLPGKFYTLEQASKKFKIIPKEELYFNKELVYLRITEKCGAQLFSQNFMAKIN